LAVPKYPQDFSSSRGTAAFASIWAGIADSSRYSASTAAESHPRTILRAISNTFRTHSACNFLWKYHYHEPWG
jgi:hypothetical protein